MTTVFAGPCVTIQQHSISYSLGGNFVLRVFTPILFQRNFGLESRRGRFPRTRTTHSTRAALLCQLVSDFKTSRSVVPTGRHTWQTILHSGRRTLCDRATRRYMTMWGQTCLTLRNHPHLLYRQTHSTPTRKISHCKGIIYLNVLTKSSL